MKFNELIEKYEIKPAIAAGVSIKLRVAEDAEVSEAAFTKAYEDFLGVDFEGKNTAARDLDKSVQAKKSRSASGNQKNSAAAATEQKDGN